jgi:hypothetical protein
VSRATGRAGDDARRMGPISESGRSPLGWPSRPVSKDRRGDSWASSAASRPSRRRSPDAKCRNDYVAIIAEGAGGKQPPLLSLTQMLWIAQAVRSARPLAAPSDFLVFGLGLGAPRALLGRARARQRPRARPSAPAPLDARRRAASSAPLPPKDSAIWAAANCGGRTVFLENTQAWYDRITGQVPGLEVHMVRRRRGGERGEATAAAGGAPPLPGAFATRGEECLLPALPRARPCSPLSASPAPAPLRSPVPNVALLSPPPRRPALRRPGPAVRQVNYTSSLDRPEEFFKSPSEPQMPPALAGVCWDVVLVDSPMGYRQGEGQPGRFQPVYWAINMARRCIAAGTKRQAS